MTTQPPSQPVKYPRGKHPNSLKHLKPYLPGTNGSPKHGSSLTARLKNALLEPIKTPDVNAPAADLIVYATIQQALDGQAHASNQVWDRADGRLTDERPASQDNRVFNIIVGSEQAKALTENVAKRLKEG